MPPWAGSRLQAAPPIHRTMATQGKSGEGAGGQWQKQASSNARRPAGGKSTTLGSGLASNDARCAGWIRPADRRPTHRQSIRPWGSDDALTEQPGASPTHGSRPALAHQLLAVGAARSRCEEEGDWGESIVRSWWTGARHGVTQAGR